MLAERWNSKKEPKKMLEIKSTVIEMKKAFDGLIKKLDIVEKESLSLGIC